MNIDIKLPETADYKKASHNTSLSEAQESTGALHTAKITDIEKEARNEAGTYNIDISPEAKLIKFSDAKDKNKTKNKHNNAKHTSDSFKHDNSITGAYDYDEEFVDQYYDKNIDDQLSSSNIATAFFDKMSQKMKKQFIENNAEKEAINTHTHNDFHDKPLIQNSSASLKKITSWTLVQKFIETFDAKNYGGQLFAFNGEFHEAINDLKAKGLMTQIVSAEDRLKLRDRDYCDAYKMLLCNLDIYGHDLPLNEHLILLNDGLIDVKKLKRKKNNAKYFINYKINAKITRDTATPNFDNFLENASGGNSQVKRRIIEFLAYCLLPENSGKCFFVLGLAPNSGKSLIADFLGEIFGSENVSHVALHDFAKDFSLAPLKNKNLNCSMDLNSEIVSAKAISKLKNLTGNDPVELNEKFQPIVKFRCRAKLVFGTNHPILLNEYDEAFWDRLIYVPFLHSVPKHKQDKNLLKKLIAEKDAIVTKLVFEANKLIHKNYVFSKCDIANSITRQWRYGKEAGIAEFIDNNCVVTFDRNQRTHTRILYNAYLKFCNINDYLSVSENQFSRILTTTYHLTQNRWVEEFGGASLRGFEGIILLTEN